HRFRTDIEDEAVDFVDHFFSKVLNVVLANVVNSQDKGLNLTEVLQVLSCEGNVLQGAGRSRHHFFYALSVRIESNFPSLMPLSRDAIVGIQRLDSDVLAVDVIRACNFEFLFLLRELANDVRNWDRRFFLAKFRGPLREGQQTG